MKSNKIPQKHVKGAIDRFFDKTKELPHEISNSHKEGNWDIVICKSANYMHEVGYKTMFGITEYCIFS
jgi:hypothetical protein